MLIVVLPPLLKNDEEFQIEFLLVALQKVEQTVLRMKVFHQAPLSSSFSSFHKSHRSISEVLEVDNLRYLMNRNRNYRLKLLPAPFHFQQCPNTVLHHPYKFPTVQLTINFNVELRIPPKLHTSDFIEKVANLRTSGLILQ